MAAYTIGSYVFDLVVSPDDVGALNAEVRLQEREGIDGHEVVGVGKRAGSFHWKGCYTWSSSAANARTANASVQALQGTIVTIIDAYTNSITNVLVERVSPPVIPHPVLKDGSTKYQTVFDVTMRKLS